MSDTKEISQDLPEKFEEALQELKNIVGSLEDEALSLEDAIQAYQRGVALSQVCSDKLQLAEQQVKVLQDDQLSDLSSQE